MPFERLFTAEDRRQAAGPRAGAGRYDMANARATASGCARTAAIWWRWCCGAARHSARRETLGYLKLTQDITERKRLERELEAVLRDTGGAPGRRRAPAHAEGRVPGHDFARAAHAALSAILGWAHVLERGTSTRGQLQLRAAGDLAQRRRSS